MKLSTLFAAAIACAIALPASAQVKKENVPGVTNFAQLETTVACGGVITPASVAELKTRGFKSVFSLQLADEKGADIPGELKAAKDAGMTFVHVPFSPAKPDNWVVDKFLTEVVKPENTPAFIHCAGGNRAAGFWAIKRLVVDKWPAEKAMAEAEALGLTAPNMKEFALEYAKTHQK